MRSKVKRKISTLEKNRCTRSLPPKRIWTGKLSILAPLATALLGYNAAIR